MPRYFFHITSKDVCQDHEGLICRDLNVARSEAIRATAEMLKDGYRDFYAGEFLLMEVQDENGVTVCNLSFSCH